MPAPKRRSCSLRENDFFACLGAREKVHADELRPADLHLAVLLRYRFPPIQVQSQRHEGWQALATHCDDGGFSGGNMERPALKRLMADIEEGKINTVVVYKVDRFTRSLADFAKIIEKFDAKQVSFVSFAWEIFAVGA
jgi:Resolvase, N terminal domain